MSRQCAAAVSESKTLPAALGAVFKTNDWREVVCHPDVHIVAELVGGTVVAREIIDAAITGKEVGGYGQ